MKRLKKACLIGLLVASFLLGAVSVVWAKPTVHSSPAHWRQVALRGEVKAVDGTNITVTSRRGKVTLLTDEATRVRLFEDDQGTLADVHVGDRIAVRGKLIGIRVVRARTIFVIPEGISILRGEVTAIEPNGFGLKTRDGELTVLVDNHSRFRISGVREPGSSDLDVGTSAIVAGWWNDSGSVLAGAVAALPQRPRLGRVVGRVTAIADPFVNLELRSGGQVTVLTNDQTRFWRGTDAEADLNELEIGQLIAVAGHWEDPSRMHARFIIRPRIRPASPAGGG